MPTRFKLAVVLCMLLLVAGALWLASAGWSPFSIRAPEGTETKAPPKTAPTSSSTPGIRIEGCTAPIVPTLGEDLQPRVVPGVSIEAVRKIYGPEWKREQLGSDYVWLQDNYRLTDFDTGHGKHAATIILEALTGGVVATPDGIELGKDTFATLLAKMNARGIQTGERMQNVEGQWVLTVSFLSVCNPDFRSQYVWAVPGTPDVNESIGDGLMPRSSFSLNRTVSLYNMKTVADSGVELSGQPSTHQ